MFLQLLWLPLPVVQLEQKGVLSLTVSCHDNLSCQNSSKPELNRYWYPACCQPELLKSQLLRNFQKASCRPIVAGCYGNTAYQVSIKLLPSRLPWWHHTCHRSKWFVLSSRPAASLLELFRKSSYPSPPEMTNILVAKVRAWKLAEARRAVLLNCSATSSADLKPVGNSTLVKKRTCPVWPCTRPTWQKLKYVQVSLLL